MQKRNVNSPNSKTNKIIHRLILKVKKNLFFTILIILVILGIGIPVLARQLQEEAVNLQKFHKLTSEDPLFYSSFFDQSGWEKATKMLKDSEDEFKKVSIENVPKVFAKVPIADKNDYTSSLQKLDFFPHQFLKDLIIINQKTNEFLKKPSSRLGNKLLSLYDNAADSYIQSVSLKIKILEDAKSDKKILWPLYFSFIDSTSNSEVVKNDFLAIKENGEKLKEEIGKRRKCLAGKGPCLAAPQDNKKIDSFIDSFNSKFNLKGEKIDFIKNNLPSKSSSDTKINTKGPYKIKSSCWQSPDSTQWIYLIYFTKNNGETMVLPKLATQNYYWKVTPTTSGTAGKIENSLYESGYIYYAQREATTYECEDLTFYPQLLTLDFLQEQIKSEKITKDDLENKLSYKLLVENQFGVMAPAITSVTKQIKVLELISSISDSAIMPPALISTRFAYSIFYFPFAKSIWRINKELQYFSPPEENPLTEATMITFDDLKKMGYTETQIAKFQIPTNSESFYKLLLPVVKFK